MDNIKRKFILLISKLLIAFVLITTCIPPIGTGAEDIAVDSSASSWAVPEIKQAYNYGLTYPGIMNNFGRPITREEFCIIVVKLYEKLTGTIVTAGTSPFSDTSNPEIIKANILGIVNGTGGGKFSPDLNITRQELCVMIFRTLDKAIPGLDKDVSSVPVFADNRSIAVWALDAVKFAYKNLIIKGIGNNKVDPLGRTTREQAIAIIKRTYEAFKNNPGLQANSLPTINVGGVRPRLSNERDKFIKMDFQNRLSVPTYNTQLQLYAATQTTKPLQKPGTISSVSLALTQPALPTLPTLPTLPSLTNKSTYSASPYACFIDQDGDRKRWFAFKLNTTQATKVIWQVSKAPFNGYKENWRRPSGLVASGEVVPSGGEFVVDFSAFTSVLQYPGSILRSTTGTITNLSITGRYKEIPKAQRKYYVRAVPVDALGQSIGDPGAGIEVLYGKPMTQNTSSTQAVAPSFELWACLRQGQPSGNGEFPNKLTHDIFTRGVSSSDTAPYWFQLKGLDAATYKIIVQVSMTPFKSDPASWENPSGLVYTKAYTTLPLKIAASYDNAFPITFQDFAPPDSQIGNKEITYYVRAVALKPSTSPGTAAVSFSDTRNVTYSKPAVVHIYPPPVIASVPAYDPVVRVVRYSPARWEDPNWSNQYTVTRHIRWNEMSFKVHNKVTGETLYPYQLGKAMGIYAGISEYDYENKIIPKFLVPGSGFEVVYRDEDKSWWGELWDEIAQFFSSIVDIISKVVNWVSTTYNNLKTGLIKLVAANLPLIPDGWRDELEQALTALVDTGLASLGIPPTLPNFDQLTNMSLDYLAEIALEESGIPATDITKGMVEQVAKGIGDEIAKSVTTPAPNPLNSNFIRNDPDYLYQPAFIELEISNPYTNHQTASGSINADVRWEWRENATVYYEGFSHGYSGYDPNAADFNYYFLNTMRRNTDGTYSYPVYYPVFEPVRGQPIPSLLPGEKTTVRVYLKEYIGKAYPWAAESAVVTDLAFMNLYWGYVGQSDFRVSMSYNLPDPKQQGQAMGIKGDVYNYSYSSQQYFTFKGVPANPYTP